MRPNRPRSRAVWRRVTRCAAAPLLCLCLLVASATVAEAASYENKRVLHVASYHEGNVWTDRIAAALSETLASTGIELQIIHMDAKRNRSEASQREAAARVNALIESFRPDVVTASDDAAARYVIMPHHRNTALPFVFCGVNWDASDYGFPYTNVTGMIEVSPIPQIVRLLRRHAAGERIGLLTEDTPTKRKELAYHRRLFGIEYEKAYFVATFADWKEAFLRAQDEVDMLVIMDHAAVVDFDDEAARTLAEQQTRIPTGTDFGWLMHLAMIGVGKVPEEQGRWAARAALKILSGTEPTAIPLSYNKEGELFFNPRIAERLGVAEAPPLAKIVQ